MCEDGDTKGECVSATHQWLWRKSSIWLPGNENRLVIKVIQAFRPIIHSWSCITWPSLHIHLLFWKNGKNDIHIGYKCDSNSSSALNLCVWHSWVSVVWECRNLHFLRVCVHVLLFHTSLTEEDGGAVSPSATHTHRIRWMYHHLHSHASTDGCRVTIEAGGPQPSCFCPCSFSCLLTVVEYKDFRVHTLKECTVFSCYSVNLLCRILSLRH